MMKTQEKLTFGPAVTAKTATKAPLATFPVRGNPAAGELQSHRPPMVRLSASDDMA